MSKQYIKVPSFTTINEIIDKEYTLSATQYKSLCIKNNNKKILADFLDRELKRSDLGYEVGSENYVDYSSYKFIKTKALQPESYLPNIIKESLQYITPKSYIKTNLKKGDILISKDGNVGEAIILDKDYPNTMLCSGIYKLPITINKYYLLAFIKNEIFKQQIDFLVPRGSTIRHGKTKFLDCMIPMPNFNKENTIIYIELLVKAIINKEIEIRKKYDQILKAIRKELSINQKNEQFVYLMPTINEILTLDRMDASLYTKNFKKEEFLIINYLYGYKTLKGMGFKGIRGTSLESKNIKTRIDSDEYRKGYYELIIPTNITKYGTVTKSTYIGTTAKLKTISQGDIVFGGEGYGKGKSFVVIENVNNVATNYHGIRIICEKNISLTKKIFVKCFLSYLRENNMIDSYGVGGNGGHLAPVYFELLKIPCFPETVENNIAKLYYNSNAIYDTKYCSLNNFQEYDNNFNQYAGIYNLDKSLKYLKNILKKSIENIANDIEVNIRF